MLNFGLWSSSKGMGIIPNLEGLTLNEARTAITSAGFALGNETSIGNSGGANSSNNGKAKARVDTGSLLQYESTIDFEYYSYVVVPTPVAPTPVAPTPVAPVAPPYPNIGSVIAYGAGPNQAWTPNDAYVTWGGSGWGSYKVELGTGVYQSSMTSAGGPPLLFSNLSAGTNYSVTVTLYAGGNWTGASASASTNFTTASVVPTPVAPVTPTPPANQLATPQISVYRGWQVYPGSVYATFDVTNDSSYPYPYTYTSTLGTQNPEFPEQFIAENLTPNQSYTVYITVSKPGYTSATGSATFNATPAENPTPVAPTPVAPTPVAPTPVAPTPVAPTPVAPTLTTYYGCCSSGDGAVGQYANSGAAATGLQQYCAQEAGSNLVGGVYTTPQSCNPAPTPVAPTPTAPTPTAPTPTAWATPLSGYHMCTSADAPNPNMPLCNSQNIGSCVNNSATGASCTVPVAPVAPTPTATCPPNDGRSYTNTRTSTNTCSELGLTYVCTDGLFQYCLAATPTPTAPTPVAPVAPTPLPCSTANGNCGSSPCSDCDSSRSGPTPDSGCPSGYRNLCWTGGSCPNTGECVPVTTPTEPAPVAPTAPAPTPTAPAPTGGCVYNGNITIVPCGYNNCVYDNCGEFVGYTST
jgi:hypothetical protein